MVVMYFVKNKIVFVKKKKKKLLGLPWWSSGLRLQASTARDAGLIPGWGIKIPHAVWDSPKTKNKKT